MSARKYDDLSVADFINARSRILGRRIQELREENGWTQTELAKRVGYSQDTVGKWERGIRKNLTPGVVRLLAEEFGINELYLYSISAKLVRKKKKPSPCLEKAISINSSERYKLEKILDCILKA